MFEYLHCPAGFSLTLENSELPSAQKWKKQYIQICKNCTLIPSTVIKSAKNSEVDHSMICPLDRQVTFVCVGGNWITSIVCCVNSQ